LRIKGFSFVYMSFPDLIPHSEIYDRDEV